MEIKLNNDTNQATELYKEIANTWNIILDFIDINTTFQIELCSKFFRERLLFYYESKESLLKKIISEEKKVTVPQTEIFYLIFRKVFLYLLPAVPKSSQNICKFSPLRAKRK